MDCPHYLDNQGLCHQCGILLEPAWWAHYTGENEMSDYEKNCIGWNQRTDTVKITTLRKGDVFKCISGKFWRMERRTDSITHVFGEDGQPEVFANCATVILCTKHKEHESPMNQSEYA